MRNVRMSIISSTALGGKNQHLRINTNFAQATLYGCLDTRMEPSPICLGGQFLPKDFR